MEVEASTGLGGFKPSNYDENKVCNIHWFCGSTGREQVLNYTPVGTGSSQNGFKKVPANYECEWMCVQMCALEAGGYIGLWSMAIKFPRLIGPLGEFQDTLDERVASLFR